MTTPSSNLSVTEIKAFVPSKDFELSKRFYQHIHDVDAWWRKLQDSGLVEKFSVKMTAVEQQPWRMRDFCLTDPSGVLWRIAQNTV